jgi:D-serine deaminase-like pyridoxal phosphate-dependent protein
VKLQELPTPALLLDIDTFESNIRQMAAHVSRAGKALRPHAKAHKCVEIAKRQLSAGAIGVCVATVAEAELMVKAGIPGVLLTSPIADRQKCSRIAGLAPDIAVVVDHPEQVRMYGTVAAAARVTLDVLIDVDVGDHRTGIAPGAPALELARLVLRTPGLRFKGLQAYSVRASHFPEISANALSPVLELRDALRSDGIEVEMITGGSTGTYECDSATPYLTELQAGSYALMDGAYARVGVPFGHALTVLATVVSANYHDRVTVDAGFKAFSTDRPFGPDIKDIAGVRYEWAGDEFGYLYLDAPSQPVRLGDRVRFIPPHCDPTVNLYDRIHVCRGDTVEAIWPVMDRFAARRLTYV